jgi:hypothetical protein
MVLLKALLGGEDGGVADGRKVWNRQQTSKMTKLTSLAKQFTSHRELAVEEGRQTIQVIRSALPAPSLGPTPLSLAGALLLA